MTDRINSLVVYTCITGDYDSLCLPDVVETGVDYVCYTDSDFEEHGVWQMRPLPRKTGSRASDNRFVKMHPHLLFPSHHCSIYLDGDVKIVGGLTELADTSLAKGGLAMYQHPLRDCLYKEGKACAALGHDWWWVIYAQLLSYWKEGFPSCYGLFEGTVLIRKHHDELVRKIMEAWWLSYFSGVRRDQMSLMYLLWKRKCMVVNLGEADYRFGMKYFSLGAHKRSTTLSRRVRSQINRLIDSILWFCWNPLISRR